MSAKDYQRGYEDGKMELEEEVKHLRAKLDEQLPKHTVLREQAESMTVAELADNVGLTEFVIEIKDSYE